MLKAAFFGLGALLATTLLCPSARADELLEAEVESYVAAADPLFREPLLSLADDGEDRDDGEEAAGAWEFDVGVYFWIPWTDAFMGKDSIVGTGEIEVDLEDGQFGYRVTADAHKGSWGVFFDGLYMNLHDTRGGVPAKVSEFLAQLGGFYRCGTEKTVVDTMVAVRTVFFDTDLQNGSVSRTWWEPTIGARVSQEITERLRLVFRGDVGGFALGSASDLTYWIEGFVVFEATPLIHVAVGYRYMDIDYSNGGLRFRERAKGPILAVFFRW